jgi:hypothetical protein
MAKKKKSGNSWNVWAFHLAWILAVVLALFGALGGAWVTMPIWSLILVVLGLIVGFMFKLNDVVPVMILAIALALFGGSSLAVIPYIGGLLNNIVAYFVGFLTPAALIVALRKVYEMLS